MRPMNKTLCPHASRCWKGGGSYKCVYTPPFCDKPLIPKEPGNGKGEEEMSETKFTPGPWEKGGLIVGARGIIIRQQWEGTRTIDELEANDHLIAAAPDMYEALEAAILEYGKPGGPWNVPSSPGSWIEKARAAIAKARGE